MGDQRDARAAADSCHRGKAGRGDVVALQRLLDRGEQARQRAGDEVVELGAGQPDIGPEAGQVDGHRGGGLRREALLGLPALVAQAGQ